MQPNVKRASKAYQNGIMFYQGNKTTWPAEYVSADYLNFSLVVDLDKVNPNPASMTRRIYADFDIQPLIMT